MAQVVSRRFLTAKARVRSQLSPYEIYGGQSGSAIGFFPSTLVFPCHFYYTGAPLHGKMRKNESCSSQGCTISLKAAVRPYHLLRGPSPQEKKKKRNSVSQSNKLDSIKQIPSWKTNSSLASEEIPLILRNRKVYCHVHNSPPLTPSWAR
jgi:hypothetical protein